MPTVDSARIPQPILPEHKAWIDLYHFAWKIASRNIRQLRGRWHMDAAFHCARLASADAPAAVTIRSDADLTVRIRCGARQADLLATAGEKVKASL